MCHSTNKTLTVDISCLFSINLEFIIQIILFYLRLYIIICVLFLQFAVHFYPILRPYIDLLYFFRIQFCKHACRKLTIYLEDCLYISTNT